MAMSATTKANIGAGRQAGLRLNSKGLGTSPFSQAKSAASKSVRKVNSEVKSKIAKAKKKGITGKPKLGSQSIKHGTHDNFDPTPSPDSFRISKAKAILENTTRAKNRVNRRISNYCRLLGLIEFKKQGDSKKDKLKGSVQLAGGLGLAQQGIRSGLPRVLGVRLEQHGTSRKAAKNIIKEGYLDPGRGGSEGGVTKALKLPKDFLDRSKGHTFISGKNKTHPLYKERTALSSLGDVLTRKLQVLGYRGSKSGPITEIDIERGTKYLGYLGEAAAKQMVGMSKGFTEEEKAELYKRMEKLKVRYDDPQRVADIRARQKRVKEGLKSFIGTEEYLQNLRRGTTLRKGKSFDDYLTDDDFLVNPERTLYRIGKTDSPRASEAVKLAQEISQLQHDIELQQVSKGLGLKAAWASKISTSPPKGLLGVGSTIYVPGTDDYFENTFVYDPDDPFGNPAKYGKTFASEQGGFGGNALKTQEKVRGFGNRFSATKFLLEQEGNGNLVKGARKLMSANKGRVGAGAALLTVGLGGGGSLVSKGVNELKPDGKVKAHRRRVGNKVINIKSFIRDLKNGKKT